MAPQYKGHFMNGFVATLEHDQFAINNYNNTPYIARVTMLVYTFTYTTEVVSACNNGSSDSI